MDPISQIFAQRDGGVAHGQGFAQFAIQGAQLAQGQQSLNLANRRMQLDEAQDVRQQQEHDSLLTIRQELFRAQAKNVGIQVKTNEEKLKSVVESNAILPDLYRLKTAFAASPEGYEDQNLVGLVESLLKRYPSAFVAGTPGDEILMNISAVPMFKHKLKRVQEINSQLSGQGMAVQSINDNGSLTFTQSRAAGQVPLSGIGKEIADYNFAIQSGDTEAAQMLRAAIMARGQKDGMSFEFDESGRISRIAQGVGSSGTPIGIVSEAEKTANSAANIVRFGNEIIQFAKPGNVGIAGNLTRIGKELAGQFIPVDTGEEFDFSQSVTFFKGAATKILRSDSQITEDERQAIISDLPSKGFLEAPETAKHKARSAIRKVSESARRQVQRAGVALPREIMTRDELAKEVSQGRITAEEAAKIWAGSPFNQ